MSLAAAARQGHHVVVNVRPSAPLLHIRDVTLVPDKRVVEGPAGGMEPQVEPVAAAAGLSRVSR
jgi:hypothetical protein